MTEQLKDPLLLAGKALALIMQAFMAIGILGLIVGMGALLFFQVEALAEIAPGLATQGVQFPVSLAIGVMVIGGVILALIFVFFGKLRQIIATVGQGDPFQPQNATRLSTMGWLMLVTYLLMIPIGIMAAHLESIVEGSDGIDMGGSYDLSGIMLIVILFILSRVFRHGAAMRADLEGTV